MDLVETQKSQLDRGLSDTVSPAAVGSLFGAKINLFQTQIPISPDTPLVDLDAAVCDYTGYAQGTIVWQAPSVADDGTVEVVGTCAVFRPTDAVVPNNAWGLYIQDTTATYLYYLGQFDQAPLPMSSALQSITVTIRYRPATNSIVVVVS